MPYILYEQGAIFFYIDHSNFCKNSQNITAQDVFVNCIINGICVIL